MAVVEEAVEEEASAAGKCFSTVIYIHRTAQRKSLDYQHVSLNHSMD